MTPEDLDKACNAVLEAIKPGVHRALEKNLILDWFEARLTETCPRHFGGCEIPKQRAKKFQHRISSGVCR